MNPTCLVVEERVALGEPLGEYAEHVTTCERCQRVGALSTQLASTTKRRSQGPVSLRA